jgi:hypothetical protein
MEIKTFFPDAYKGDVKAVERYFKILKKNSKILKIKFKGILSTSCVIFSYPKLLSISVLTLKLNKKNNIKI